MSPYADDSPVDDWEDDPEGPQPCDLDDEEDGQTPTVPCPACGEPVAELAPRCPHCGDWITAAGARSSSRPAWIVLTVFIAVAIIILLLAW